MGLLQAFKRELFVKMTGKNRSGRWWDSSKKLPISRIGLTFFFLSNHLSREKEVIIQSGLSLGWSKKKRKFQTARQSFLPEQRNASCAPPVHICALYFKALQSKSQPKFVTWRNQNFEQDHSSTWFISMYQSSPFPKSLLSPSLL